MVLGELRLRISQLRHYYLPAWLQTRLHLREIDFFCLFIGYPRSGHSLFAQLLNAHPDILLADELVLSSEFYAPGVMQPHTEYASREKLFHHLWAKSLFDASQKHNAVFGGYSYVVPNQWQGKIRNLKVMGDKCAYEMTCLLHENKISLDALRQFVGVPLKIFHIVRNPFDVIRRRHVFRIQHNLPGSSMEHLIQEHFNVLCPNVMRVIQQEPDSVLTLYSEEIIRDSAKHLRQALAFLGVESGDQYLGDCAGVVWDKPKKIRDLSMWTQEHIEAIETAMRQVPYLNRYSYQED